MNRSESNDPLINLIARARLCIDLEATSRSSIQRVTRRRRILIQISGSILEERVELRSEDLGIVARVLPRDAVLEQSGLHSAQLSGSCVAERVAPCEVRRLELVVELKRAEMDHLVEPLDQHGFEHSGGNEAPIAVIILASPRCSDSQQRSGHERCIVL